MRPCLLTDRDEMSNLYREPSTDASYQASVHLTKWFRRRFLKIGQSETRMACGGHVCYILLLSFSNDSKINSEQNDRYHLKKDLYHQNLSHASKIMPIKRILDCWVLRGLVYL
jgi:hypothetical protein